MSRADLAHAVRRSSEGAIKATERGVRGWEKGEYVPRGDAVPALASALECKVEDLYGTADADDAEAADQMVAGLSRDEYALYGALTARILQARVPA